VVALLTLVSTSADATSAALEGSSFHDPALSEAYLFPPRQPAGRPSLRVKHYDEARGLIAGYETTGGKRILFYAKSLPNGAVMAAAYHWDQSRQSMWPLMGPGLDEMSEDGEARVTMVMTGVSVQGVLRGKAKGRPSGAEEQRLKQFLRGEAGRAFSDGVMALYVLLEPFEQDNPALARLKMPFGAMRMAAELATGHYAGFDNAEELVGKKSAKRMRQACGVGQCEYRSGQFMIQNSGLFDMLSTHGKPIEGRDKSPANCPSAASSSGLAAAKTFDGVTKDFDNECFGCCGPGCWGCTGIVTAECWGHDNCVRQHGHLACLFSAPECAEGPCNSLIAAIGSLIGAIGNWIGSWFGLSTTADPWNPWGGLGGACDLAPCNPYRTMGF
jgi:hypothetical protein